MFLHCIAYLSAGAMIINDQNWLMTFGALLRVKNKQIQRARQTKHEKDGRHKGLYKQGLEARVSAVWIQGCLWPGVEQIGYGR